jgi:hypothetical protein
MVRKGTFMQNFPAPIFASSTQSVTGNALDVCHIATDVTQKTLLRLTGLLLTVGTGGPKGQHAHCYTTATVSFSGATHFHCFFSASSSVRDALARAILRREQLDDVPMELRDDAVKEFLNIVAGKIAFHAFDLGLELTMSPTSLTSKAVINLPDDHSRYVFTMYNAQRDQAKIGIGIKPNGAGTASA